MIDNWSKYSNYGTKLLFACSAERARFKRGSKNYEKITEEAQRAPTRSQSTGPTGAIYRSGGTSAPNARKKTVGPPRGNPSSDRTRASTSHNNGRSKKRKRSKNQSVLMIGCRENNFGNSSEDTDSEDNAIWIDEAEFRNKKTHAISKRRPSIWEELNEVAASRKNISRKGKKISSTDSCRCDKGQPSKSSSLFRKGISRKNNEFTNSKKRKLEETKKLGYKTVNLPFTQKIWFPTEQPFNFLDKVISVDDASHSSSAEEGNGKDDMDSDECKVIEVEPAKKKRKASKLVPSATRRVPFERGSSSTLRKTSDGSAQGLKAKSVSRARKGLDKDNFPATYVEHANLVNEEAAPVDSRDSFSSFDGGYNSDSERINGPTSSTEGTFREDTVAKEIEIESNDEVEFKGNNDEDMDAYDTDFKEIDEAEFRNEKTHLIGKHRNRGTPTASFRGSAGKNNENRKKGGGKCVSDDSGLGVATRTRSKTRVSTKAHKVENIPIVLSVSPSYSDDSELKSYDGETDSEDFIVKDSSSGFSSDECDLQADTLIEVSEEKNEEDSSKDIHNEEKSQESSFRKRHLSGDAPNKRIRREKSKKNELFREHEDVNTVVDNGEEGPKERSKVKRNNLPKHKYSGGEGSKSSLSTKKKAVSPVISKNEDSSHSDEEVKRKCDEVEADEVTQQSKRKQYSSKPYDFCQMLADAVLGRGEMPDLKETHEEARLETVPQSGNALPLKFCFEEEVPKPVEKTEYEKEIDGCFAELDQNWILDEISSSDPPEFDEEDNVKFPSEETQYDRCCRGEHELILEDDIGLRCIYCNHVALEARYVLPPWAEKTYRASELKRYSETEQHPEFDEFHLPSSTCYSADPSFICKGTVWNIKPGVRESMYPHQQEGFEFLWKNLAGSIKFSELFNDSKPTGIGGCIISHAPGTGKTRLTIVFIETYLKLFPNSRPVIIAPASMLLTWEEEFKKWNVEFPFHNLNNLEFSGKENRDAVESLAGATRRPNKMDTRMVKIYSWKRGISILGISYSLFEKLTGEKYKKEEKKTDEKKKKPISEEHTRRLRKILFEIPGLVVLDEGHTPRNSRSNIWNALLKVHTGKRVILSGTPFQNNFAELFNTMRIVRPEIAVGLAQERTFAEMIASRRRISISGSVSKAIDNAVERLKTAIVPFVHVHKGTILQQSLPGLRDCVVLLKPPPLQKSLIERLEGSPSTFKFEHDVALISVHPYLFEHCEMQKNSLDKNGVVDMGAIKSSKLDPSEGVKSRFIVELVRLSMAMNEKVLVFSQYIKPLELITEQLKEVFKWGNGKQILWMQGKLDQRQRQTLINIFNNPKSKAKVMLASTKCCSEGISLVGASRVVLLDVVWNPSVERQAICRAYRIGQKRFVYTYHLMTSGTTEADKYCRQAEKERLSELVFCSSSNESMKPRHSGIEDRILEEMFGNEKLKDMFEKIINQPKDTDLVESFGQLVS